MLLSVTVKLPARCYSVLLQKALKNYLQSNPIPLLCNEYGHVIYQINQKFLIFQNISVNLSWKLLFTNRMASKPQNSETIIILWELKMLNNIKANGLNKDESINNNLLKVSWWAIFHKVLIFLVPELLELALRAQNGETRKSKWLYELLL